MNRIARTLTTLVLGLTVTVLGGAGMADAQEMDHGRTRPNQVKTADAIATGYISYIRG